VRSQRQEVIGKSKSSVRFPEARCGAVCNAAHGLVVSCFSLLTSHLPPLTSCLLPLTSILFLVSVSLSHGEIVMNQLPNGARLIVKSNPSNRILAIECFFRVGSYFERREENGITNLVCNCILKGTKTRNALEIAETMETIGGEIHAAAGEDYAVVSTISTVADLDTALDVLSDVILNPTFPPDEVEKERQATLAAIRQIEDISPQYAYKQFRALLYEGHPYAMPPLGTSQTVRAITQQQMVKFHSDRFTASNMLVVVVGDVQADKIGPRIADAFSKMPVGHAEVFRVSRQFRPRLRAKTVTKDVEQSFIVIGFVTDSAASQDYVPLKVASSLLGAGVSSRLFVRLRDRQGLAYAVGAAMPGLLDKSHFYAYIGTRHEAVEQARKGLIETVHGLATEPIPADELERAKNVIVGQFRIAHQRNSDQAHFLGVYDMIGLGAKFDEVYCDLVKQVTADQVRAVAAKYFTAPTVTILRPPVKK